ncbi:hypothetical protein [Bacillus atrophaeus]|uniref:hypothetical protein n=1 Tax=Bacillus atrophaeus TaxID=1452 RepID=UPI002E21BCF4|nr:hypothetical protein [Bacillus atrophaeus]
MSNSFKDFSKKLDKIQRNAKELNGTKSVPLVELLTTDFVRKNTKFMNLDEMIETSPFEINNDEDFAAIPDQEWDDYIRANSKFFNWQEMLEQATEDYVVRKLGL